MGVFGKARAMEQAGSGELRNSAVIAIHTDEVSAYETLDDAIEAALAEVDPDGGVVVVHAAWCSLDDDTEEPCDCVPMELKRGAVA